MAQTLAQVTRTVTTDFTVAATRKTASLRIRANMAALDNIATKDLKAIQVYLLADFLKTGVTVGVGTDYTADYTAIVGQAKAFYAGYGRLDARMQALIDTANIWNATKYADGTLTTTVATLVAGIVKLTPFAEEDLDKSIAFLRFKAGI